MEQQIYKAPEGSKIVSVTTEENRVVIEYEKIEDTFVPKNGDFVKTKYGSILIYSGVDIFDNAIISYAGYRMGHSTMVTGTGWGLYCDIIGLAAESEKQQLLDAIAKNGKRWNAEKKCIEKLRERAKKGSCYWSALNLGKFEPVSVLDTYDDMDNGRYESGNYFLTEFACQRLCDLLNKIVKNSE